MIDLNTANFFVTFLMNFYTNIVENSDPDFHSTFTPFLIIHVLMKSDLYIDSMLTESSNFFRKARAQIGL